MQTPPELNLAQQEVVALLGANGADRPVFESDVATALRVELERGLAPVVAQLPDGDDLYVKKFDLSAIHGCEHKYLADREVAFEWSIPKARGTIVHKAIQVGVSWKGELNPAELVDEAIARATQSTDGLGDWLRTRGDFDRADLASQVTERVTSFFECFPPLKASWKPNLEFPIRAELFDRRVVLIGKPDLSLGSARGTTAGKVIVDFKTGGFSPTHVDDLRFYALLDTLKVGTPPRLVASYYLDAGRTHAEPVTVALLHSAVARTVDGVTRFAELDEVARGRVEPAVAGVVKRTGPACRWCPALAGCAEGTAHLRNDREARDEVGDEDAIDGV